MSVSRLRNEVKKIVKKYHTDEINLYDILDNAKYEGTHSKFIGWLLNPKENHGKKDLFLNIFLHELSMIDGSDELEIVREFDSSNAVVTLEKKIKTNGKDGYIDILIEDDKYLILIENKVHSTDHSNQLKRYEEYAKSTKKEYLFLYLTLFYQDPVEESAKNVDYQKIDYTRFIWHFMQNCLENIEESELKDRMREYLKAVEKVTYLFDDNIELKEDLFQLLSKKENILLIDEIRYAENIDDLSEEDVNINIMITQFIDFIKAKYEYRFWQILSEKISTIKNINIIDSLDDLESMSDLIKYSYHYGQLIPGVSYLYEGKKYEINSYLNEIYLYINPKKYELLTKDNPFSDKCIPKFSDKYVEKIAQNIYKKIKDRK